MNKISLYDASTKKLAKDKLLTENQPGEQGAVVIAGGTDLITRLRGMISPQDPFFLVNIKAIPKMDDITVDAADNLRIGSCATLSDIAESRIVKKHSPSLAKAAGSVGGPELRNMGTIGGNICQYVRCWYYRAEFNIFPCLRKDKCRGKCYAKSGDNRYHSVFDPPTNFGCHAVNPSDTAPVLIALGAKIVTNKTETPYDAAEFFSETTEKTTILADDEFITEIQLPYIQTLKPWTTSVVKTSFRKFAIRKSIDFAIVNCAAVIEKDKQTNVVTKANIWLNGVYITPRRSKEAETSILNSELDTTNAEKAGEAAAKSSNVNPLSHNAYKKWIMKAMIKGALEDCI